ncbi:hypothetical protein ZWY2020_058901 [Hordeum vulgare]|nr:hypothetical protein ZWY2020_058901 [Hordeum vulgare]
MVRRWTAGRSRVGTTARHRQGRSDRKSGSGMSGDAKKGGRGGKFTWEEDAEGYTDEDLDLVASKGPGTDASATGKNKS